MLLKLLGSTCLAAALLIFMVIVYSYSSHRPGPLLFAPSQVLAATWNEYKKTHIEAGTYRTLDPQRNNITTSEGQSYTMLRAVWEGDKEVFDGAWKWARDNLGRPSDALFSWLWGVRANGTAGVLTEENGQNTASDADTDIALALLFAYSRWQNPDHLTEARRVITDLWEKEVVSIGGKPYMAANDLEKASRGQWIIVNPSYFHPAAYRLFAQVDPPHDWEGLRKNSYTVLHQSTQQPLDKARSAGLPPDWIRIHKTTGAIAVLPDTEHSRFGFDAMRIPFRIALDYAWFANPDAETYLTSLSFLGSEWETHGKLASTYSHDGMAELTGEVPAMYGGTIGYFMLTDPEKADLIHRQKLLSLFNAETATWTTQLSYYDENIAWFGIALYNHQLPNLMKDMPASAFR